MSCRSFKKKTACNDGERPCVPKTIEVRAPVPQEMQVAIVLHKVGRCGECCIITNHFGVHKFTVKEFSNAISENIHVHKMLLNLTNIVISHIAGKMLNLEA